jgi:hypothetical protein
MKYPAQTLNIVRKRLKLHLNTERADRSFHTLKASDQEGRSTRNLQRSWCSSRSMANVDKTIFQKQRVVAAALLTYGMYVSGMLSFTEAMPDVQSLCRFTRPHAYGEIFWDPVLSGRTRADHTDDAHAN